MTSSLVGYTGFVGSNLAASHEFDDLYNSKNIQKAYGTNPDLLIYSGLRAEKFLANKFPEQDLASVKEAFSNIQKINPETVVLISTVDVYQNPVGVTEDSPIRTGNLAAYGLHRYMLERWIEAVKVLCKEENISVKLLVVVVLFSLSFPPGNYI